jgi:hypothetical protein
VSVAILTPFTGSTAELAGGKWRKKLLPIGEISYKGRVLKFTRDYLAGLVEAFRNRAYDQVPFQLADAGNTHTNDPERTRGQITGMTLEPDGLWVEMDPTERGSEVLADNPGLGVSARIVEEYDRADGKFFPRAIQHVLGTLDPRITGMGGWEAIAAANDAEVTFDLSGEQFITRKEPGMAELTDDQQSRLAALLNIDPAKLAALADKVDPAALDALAGSTPEPGSAEDAEISEIAARIDAMTDEELDAWAAELEAEEAADAGAGAPAAAGALSNADRMAVELAQATGDEASRQLGIIQGQLDHERWLGERSRLAASIPPYIADLAQPLLEGAGHVVELAGGKSVDAGQIMRQVLGEFGKVMQGLGFETGVELGSSADEPDGAAVERDDVLKRARSQMFGMRGT